MGLGGVIKGLAIGVAAIVAIAAVPVARNELSCMRPLETKAVSYVPLLPPELRREAVNSMLTYPEWSIVHAYEDFAGVIRQKGESDFSYWQSVAGYWKSLCSLSGQASARGTVAPDMKAMLYIIGISFSAEMAVKGLYESTIGRLTAAIRGSQRTPEDTFALGVAEDYAAFLRQTPWYEYPFWPVLQRFWKETSPGMPTSVRSAERKVALSMEYGVKAVYAKALGALAAADPAKLTIDTIITGMSREQLAADKAVTVKGELGGGLWVETPRYRAYTEFLQRVARAGGGIREIAGNDRIFVTFLAPSTGRALAPSMPVMFRVPLQARPGWARYGAEIPVTALPETMLALERAGAVFEHAYDY